MLPVETYNENYGIYIDTGRHKTPWGKMDTFDVHLAPFQYTNSVTVIHRFLIEWFFDRPSYKPNRFPFPAISKHVSRSLAQQVRLKHKFLLHLISEL